MHDLKFLEALKVQQWKHLALKTYVHQAVQESAKAYIQNHERNNGWAWLPGFMFMTGDRWGDAIRTASISLGGRIESQEFYDAASRIYSIKGLSRNVGQVLREHGEATMWGEKLSEGIPQVLEIFRHMLEAMVINAWTAHEVLTADLLNKSMDLHSECFRSGVDRSKHKFTKRSFSRASYADAFDNDQAVINPLCNQSVDCLCLLRNLLVHCGGLVDQKFLEDCRDIGAIAWSQLPKGSRFEVTGETVRNLIDRNLPIGFNLLKAVDNWLAAHKPI